MIKLTNLTKKFDQQIVLDKANYSFDEVGITCILGPSGSGKSTLLNILSGCDIKYDGSVTVMGDELKALNSVALTNYRKNMIGFVFQNYQLISNYSVLDNILLAAELNEHTTEDNTIKAIEILTSLGLEEKKDEKVDNLSGGQKQRVAIARALINDPKIIFADEPTGALDEENSNSIMEILEELSSSKLVIMITHDENLTIYADEIISIEDGKVKSLKRGDLFDERKKQSYMTKTFESKDAGKVNTFKWGLKNYKANFTKLFLVCMSIAFGIIFSFNSISSQNITEDSIETFKSDNKAFNNGYITNQTGGFQEQKVDVEYYENILTKLRGKEGITNVYYLHTLENTVIVFNGEEVKINKKKPLPKVKANLSYGKMPEEEKNEIAISPSLARKYGDNISDLLGKDIILKNNNKEYNLKITGIFDAPFDDFILSTDIEKELFEVLSDDSIYAISYDVKDFNDIISITEWLNGQDINPITAVEQIKAFLKTFESIRQLFIILSILIFMIVLFISIVMLIKFMNTRTKEIGLLRAIGYSRARVRKILRVESFLIASTATILSLTMAVIFEQVAVLILNKSVELTSGQVISVMGISFVLVFIINAIASQRLLLVEPSEAMK